MITKIKSFFSNSKTKLTALTAFALTAFVAPSAFAQEAELPDGFDTEAGQSLLTDLFTDLGVMIAIGLGGLVTLLGAVIGFMWVWRQITKRVGKAK